MLIVGVGGKGIVQMRPRLFPQYSGLPVCCLVVPFVGIAGRTGEQEVAPSECESAVRFLWFDVLHVEVHCLDGAFTVSAELAHGGDQIGFRILVIGQRDSGSNVIYRPHRAPSPSRFPSLNATTRWTSRNARYAGSSGKGSTSSSNRALSASSCCSSPGWADSKRR